MTGARDLIAFPSMLQGRTIETDELAYETAVELSVEALQPPADPVGDPSRDIAEPLHDALSRLGALSDARKLPKIS